MTSSKLTPGGERLLAALILLALVALAILAIAIPLKRAHAHYDRSLDTATDKIWRLQRIAAQRNENARLLEAVRSRDPAKFFLKNSASNLAGAELQDLVRAAVESQGGRIISVQVGQPREDNGYRVYTVNTTINASAEALQKILHSMEVREPYVFVEALQVRSPYTYGARPNPPGTPEPQLNIQLEAAAYAQAPVARVARPSATTAPAAGGTQ